ncbi:MAG: hypothetical protein ABI612_16705 [Betaproteobacteria bacterium]
MGEQRNPDELAVLRAEIELLRSERRNLLRASGAAAVFLAKLDSHALPESTYDAADVLAVALSDLSEDTLRDAIELIRKEEGAIVRIRAEDDLDS